MILSGVGLYYSMEKEPNVKQFYSKQAIRILPSLYIVSFLYYGCVNQPIRLLDYFCDSLLISFYTKGDRSFWFIALIIVLYLLFPLIYKVLKRFHTAGFIVLLAAAFVLNVLLLLCCQSYYLLTEIAWARIPVFLTGAWLGKLMYDGVCCSKRILYPVSIIVILISLALLFTLNGFLHTRFYLARFLFSVAGIFVTLLLSAGLNRIRVAFPGKALRFFGLFSLEFYLLFERMEFLACAFVYQDENGIIFSIAVFIMTLIAVVLLKTVVTHLWVSKN